MTHCLAELCPAMLYVQRFHPVHVTQPHIQIHTGNLESQIKLFIPNRDLCKYLTGMLQGNIELLFTTVKCYSL